MPPEMREMRGGAGCGAAVHRGANLAGVRKPTSPIQAVQTAPDGGFYRLTRPGARYVVTRQGDERPGSWVPDGDALDALDPQAVDAFPEDEARSLLAVLRALEGRAAGKGGRRAAEPTSPDGRLVARARKQLGLTMAGLAEAIGADPAQLSRALSGELPAKHREKLKELLTAERERNDAR